MLLACVLFTGTSGAATGVGGASATVLPSSLSAAVTLYIRTASGRLCTAGCAATAAGPWPPYARTTPVALDQDGIAQFTMFGDTTSNYVVRLNDAVYGDWPDRIGTPIVLEPTLSQGGRLTIMVGQAPFELVCRRVSSCHQL